MLVVAGSTLAASFLACIVPGLQAARTNVSEVLKDEGRGSSGFHIGRFSGALVVAEVAVSCGLLIAAGLMIKSVVQLKTLNLPFAVANIVTARINLPRLQYPDAEACVRFYERLLPGLQEIPGVEAATLSDGLPAAGNGTIAIQVEGGTYSRDTDYPVVREGIVTPGYFQTFQTRVLRGREFTVSDRQGNQPVAMINESFARTHFPDQEPLGRRMKRGRSDSKEPWLTIVGIVPDMLMQGLGNNNQSPVGYYIPIAQSDVTNFVSIALRTRGEPGAVTAAVRSAVTALDKDLAIYQVLSMKEVIRVQSWFYTVFGTFFMAFGCSALFLAMAGLYGVMSFAVSRRKKEMGIRMALGAQGGQLVRLIMRRALIQMSLGLGLGLVFGLLAAGPLQPILYRVAPRDPFVMAIVVLALAAAGFLASFLPARRVTRIDPVLALSAE
jgi:predicted permease